MKKWIAFIIFVLPHIFLTAQIDTTQILSFKKQETDWDSTKWSLILIEKVELNSQKHGYKVSWKRNDSEAFRFDFFTEKYSLWESNETIIRNDTVSHIHIHFLHNEKKCYEIYYSVGENFMKYRDFILLENGLESCKYRDYSNCIHYIKTKGTLIKSKSNVHYQILSANSKCTLNEIKKKNPKKWQAQN